MWGSAGICCSRSERCGKFATNYLVSRQVKFTVDSEQTICDSGDSWCIAGNKEHSAEALQDSVLVEVFSPVWEDYFGVGRG